MFQLKQAQRFKNCPLAADSEQRAVTGAFTGFAFWQLIISDSASCRQNGSNGQKNHSKG
jgi:hypothetical protein